MKCEQAESGSGAKPVCNVYDTFLRLPAEQIQNMSSRLVPPKRSTAGGMAPQAGFARSNAPEDDLHELERNRPADDPQELEHERLMAKDSRNNIDVAMLEGLKKEFQVQDNGDCVGLDLEEVRMRYVSTFLIRRHFFHRPSSCFCMRFGPQFKEKCGPVLGENLTDQEIGYLFMKIDANSDGSVDWVLFFVLVPSCSRLHRLSSQNFFLLFLPLSQDEFTNFFLQMFQQADKIKSDSVRAACSVLFPSLHGLDDHSLPRLLVWYRFFASAEWCVRHRVCRAPAAQFLRPVALSSRHGRPHCAAARSGQIRHHQV